MTFAPKPTNPSRRNFLKVGLVGSAVLATVGVTAGIVSFNKVSNQPAAEGFTFLRKSDAVILAAIIPAVLGTTLTANQAERQTIIDKMLIRIDDSIAHMGEPNKKQVLQLFDLLSFAPTRYLAARVKTAWDKATQDEVESFLESWRYSRVGLFNAAYRMLTKVATVTYFALPVSFAESGYPGPWATMYNAVNS